MPGELQVNDSTQIYTEFVKGNLPLADQANVAANDGFGEGYQPQGRILCNTIAVAGGRGARLVAYVHPDQPPEVQQLISEALAEFHQNHPKGLELIGKMMRGEIDDQPGIEGSANWRSTFAGAAYNAGDGVGSFTVEAP